jgi:toxin YoeB
MRVRYTALGVSDHRYWQTHDPDTAQRIDHLLDLTQRHPTQGPGNPLPLRHLLEGCWSRRIDGEHRLVYLVEGDDVVVLQARYHYENGS